MSAPRRITFDPRKNEENLRKHGMALGDFFGFDSELVTITDRRRDYGEERWQTFGRIDGLGYMIAFTIRGDELRLISFRRAHEKEIKIHDRAS